MNTGLVLFTIIVVLVAFAFIAGQLLVTLVSSYVVIGGGVLLLGFGGSRWTRSVTERYLSYAIATGVQLFVLFLVVGVGHTMTPTWTENLVDRAGFDLAAYLEIAGGAIVYLLLVWRIPGLAYDMMHGALSFTMREGERMAVSGMSAGIAGGRMIGGGAAVMANAAAGPVGTLTAAVRMNFCTLHGWEQEVRKYRQSMPLQVNEWERMFPVER